MNRNSTAASLPASVQAMSDLKITGNVVHPQWFKTITFSNGKPDTNSILILSDIVYWYRPTEVRDERSGSIIGYRKKFAEDLLRKSYSDLQNQFGLSDRQLRDCFSRLEELGVIKRVFRTVDTSSGRLNNVMYIELIPQILKDITFNNPPKPMVSTYSDPINIERDTYHDRTGQVLTSNVTPMTIERDTYPVVTRDHIKDTNTTSNISSNNSLSVDSDKFFMKKSEREDLKNRKEKSISDRMLDIWNQTVTSKQVPLLNSYLSREMALAFREQLGSDLANWQKVCEHFISSKFLMGEAEGIRIDPDLSWLVSSKEPRVSRVLLKQHYTFGDRLIPQSKALNISEVISQIDTSSEDIVVKAVRRKMLTKDPAFYLSYLAKSEIQKDGKLLTLRAMTEFAKEKIAENVLDPMGAYLKREYEMTLKLI